MKKIIIFILIILSFGFTADLIAQSKTEEARERMRGNKSSTSSSAFVFFFETTLEFMPYLFFFTGNEPDTPGLTYNPTPFDRVQRGYGYGIRDFSGDGQVGMLDTQFILHLPTTSKAPSVTSADVRWHLQYWALRGGYSYMKEAVAPFGIHQYHASVERKFRFLNQADAGFFMGYRSFHLSGDQFHGFDTGADVTLYVTNPVSIQYKFEMTVLKYDEATQHHALLNIHRDRFRFTLGYRHLNLYGVPFSAAVAGVGLNL
jgi:hypothetical protein